MNGHDAKASPMPAVRTVSAGAPLTWLARGFADFRAHPLPSLFYGACFALMGWLIAVVFEPVYYKHLTLPTNYTV